MPEMLRLLQSGTVGAVLPDTEARATTSATMIRSAYGASNPQTKNFSATAPNKSGMKFVAFGSKLV
jgi:hypothetical protein